MKLKHCNLKKGNVLPWLPERFDVKRGHKPSLGTIDLAELPFNLKQKSTIEMLFYFFGLTDKLQNTDEQKYVSHYTVDLYWK